MVDQNDLGLKEGPEGGGEQPGSRLPNTVATSYMWLFD